MRRVSPSNPVPDDGPIEFGVSPEGSAPSPTPPETGDDRGPGAASRPGTDQPWAETGAPDTEASTDAQSTDAQPTDAQPTDAQPTDAQSAEDPRPPTVWNSRSVFLIGLAVVMALCAAAFGTAFVLYDRATRPDRSTPGLVVTKYVEAVFNQRDPSLARRYVCRNPDLGAVDTAVDDLVSRERQFNVTFLVSPGNFVETVKGPQATVDADLEVTTSRSGSTRRWTFTLVRQDGWRVCGARRVS